MTETPQPESQGGRYCFGSPAHRHFLLTDAQRQFDFFRASLRPEGGFFVLRHDGTPQQSAVQELHTTTRLVHSYALGALAGFADCAQIIDQGLHFLQTRHRDSVYGGYVWATEGASTRDGRKIGYGHMFVLLAAASAQAAGHPGAPRLMADIEAVLESRFWDATHGLFKEEWQQDWAPFSTYRGMNSNMHAVEALLAAYEVTGREVFLTRAGGIIDFFLNRIAAAHGWRFAEHYTQDWQIDPDYQGDPVFRPAGTTPGHAFEWARLVLQYWDLCGRRDGGLLSGVRAVVAQALADGWDPRRGGLYYTLCADGRPDIRDRYWWPLTEALNVLAALLKCDPQASDAAWYQRMWHFADGHFIDHKQGGWFPELDANGTPTEKQFTGKPDIYHSVQAVLFPLCAGVSRLYEGLRTLAAEPHGDDVFL
ncbi:MAG: AGE family epimerase/isomerase [Rhodobacteraceae bacterium]|nr:AGE family epimerase/isomerase [Paracoccaceae bacterium]